MRPGGDQAFESLQTTPKKQVCFEEEQKEVSNTNNPLSALFFIITPFKKRSQA